MFDHMRSKTVLVLLSCLALGFLVAGGAAAQGEISGSPSEERSDRETGFESPEFSPQQRATMAYNSGVRNLKSGESAEEKAAEATTDKKREKLESRAIKAYERAVGDFETAARLQPENAPALIGLGKALSRVDRYEDALKAYNQALAIAPEDAEGLAGRADVFLGLDHAREAAASYNLLLPVDANRAGELLAAIKRWVQEHRADPAGIDPELLKALDEWIAEKDGPAR